MITFLMVIAILMYGAALLWVSGAFVKRTTVEIDGLTHFSRQVMYLYNSLPEDNRPWRREELLATLKALDTKHGIEIKRHYYINIQWSEYNTVWVDMGYGLDDHLDEYKPLVESICDIQAAVNKQERVFLLAGIPAEQLDISTMTERARAEVGIVNAVTRELVG